MKDYIEKKGLYIKIDGPTLKQLKIEAIEKDTTITDLIKSLIVKRYTKK